MSLNMTTFSLLALMLSVFSFSSAIGSEFTSANEVITEKSNLQTYIVHVKQPGATHLTRADGLKKWHNSFLPVRPMSEGDQQPMLYSYRNVISGFAARLTEDEVKAMEKKDGFLYARPERILRVQTTHTPNFLGLNQVSGFWKKSNFGKGVIVGVLDTGVLPSHPSFNDDGMPPPPAKWKGRCDFQNSECNNKLIGARSFNLAAKVINKTKNEAPLDDDGHGTHTASTAAGGFVKDANVLGNANGTAVGMAPYAHLAIYKVCFGEDCPDSDILAGLDAAIDDGVDVLSISLGVESAPFFQNSIAVGSFHAMQKGIFVSCSAGNSGPFNGTLFNDAPWILTVGASTIDRTIIATAKLGNGEEFDGESLFHPDNFPSTLLPLVYAGTNGTADSALCGPGSLTNIDVNGKVVLCERGGGIGRIAKGEEVKSAGGAAMVLMNEENDGFSTLADAHVLPATHVAFVDGLKIKAYINSSTNPTATILFKGTVIGNSQSPSVASFSSRGPSLVSPGILKPDVIGPGVNILAAWPFPLENITSSKPTFNIISGTSMSCPHLSGIAALLKSLHPSWTPAAIKSAIMTSADRLNLQGKPIVDQTLGEADIFATGSGHVNPSRASNPGLIYDIQPDDYIPYLCGPSFSVALGPSQTFKRSVTNVGEAHSSYSVAIEAPQGVRVTVKPDKLYFSEVNQKETYSVTFTRIAFGDEASEYVHGFLKWVSAKHFVRSPISVRLLSESGV